MDELGPNAANSCPLTPLGFLERTATVYGDLPSVVYNATTFTWSQTHRRCLRLASALSSLGISSGDVVSVLAPNVPAMYEMHFGVPMSGAILNTINTRLDARTISVLLRHGNAKLVFVDTLSLSLIIDALSLLPSNHPPPRVVHVEDPYLVREEHEPSIGLTYEKLIESGDPEFRWVRPKSEWDPMVLNYTSGTTSAPKGVVHCHRGLFIRTMDSLMDWSVPKNPVYLWTLPMFHANGWSFPWGVAAAGGINVCLRRVEARAVYEAIAARGVTHMCGAPVVLNMLARCPEAKRRPLPGTVHVFTGGAPTLASVLGRAEALGFSVTHGYGLTETGGVAVSCAWKGEWDRLPATERARLKARQDPRTSAIELLELFSSRSVDSIFMRHQVKLRYLREISASILQAAPQSSRTRVETPDAKFEREMAEIDLDAEVPVPPNFAMYMSIINREFLESEPRHAAKQLLKAYSGLYRSKPYVRREIKRRYLREMANLKVGDDATPESDYEILEGDIGSPQEPAFDLPDTVDSFPSMDHEIGSSSANPLSPEEGETEIILPSYKIGTSPTFADAWLADVYDKLRTFHHSTIKSAAGGTVPLKEEIARLQREADAFKQREGRLRQEIDILKGDKDSLRVERDQLLDDKHTLAAEKESLADSLKKSEADLEDTRMRWGESMDTTSGEMKAYVEALTTCYVKLANYRARLVAVGEAVTPANSPPGSPQVNEAPASTPSPGVDQDNQVDDFDFPIDLDLLKEADSSPTPTLVVQPRAPNDRGVSLLKARELKWKRVATGHHDRCVVLEKQVKQLEAKLGELVDVDRMADELKDAKVYITELKKMADEKSGLISNCCTFFKQLGSLVNAPDHSRAYTVANQISLLNKDIRKSIEEIARRAKISEREYQFYFSRTKKLSALYDTEKRLREDLIQMHRQCLSNLEYGCEVLISVRDKATARGWDLPEVSKAVEEFIIETKKERKYLMDVHTYVRDHLTGKPGVGTSQPAQLSSGPAEDNSMLSTSPSRIPTD